MKSLLATAILIQGIFASPLQTPSFPDVVYATVGEASLHLNLHVPSTPSGPRPVLLFFHGGGWSSGSYAGLSSTLLDALDRGFAVANVEYRLTSQAERFAPEPVTFPAQIHDAKAAVRFLRAHAEAYGLDPARFASAGVSAGGHLATLLAVSEGVVELEGAVGEHVGVSSAVQASVDFSGPVDLLHLAPDATVPPGRAIQYDAPHSPASRLLGWAEPGQGLGDLRAHLGDMTPPYPDLIRLANAANPVTWVDPSDPPMFIAHGVNDRTVPVRQSARLAEALKAVGVSHEFHAIPGAGHILQGPIGAEAIRFLEHQLGRAKERRPRTPSTVAAVGLVELVDPFACALNRPGYRASGSLDRFDKWDSAHSITVCGATGSDFAESLELNSAMAGTTWRYRVWSRDAER